MDRIADHNADARPDIFVICRGYDVAPFPGEKDQVVLSRPNGTHVISDAAADVGFGHGGAAADFNGDGYPDVLAVNDQDPARAAVFLNSGDGAFTREPVGRLPST